MEVRGQLLGVFSLHGFPETELKAVRLGSRHLYWLSNLAGLWQFFFSLTWNLWTRLTRPCRALCCSAALVEKGWLCTHRSLVVHAVMLRVKVHFLCGVRLPFSGLFCLNSSMEPWVWGTLLYLSNLTTQQNTHSRDFTSSTLASTQGIINASLTAVAWLPLDHHSISFSELKIETGESLAGGSLKSASHVYCGFGFLAFFYDLYYNYITGLCTAQPYAAPKLEELWAE